MIKVGRSSVIFENVYLKSCSTVTGPVEKNGPIGAYFDKTYDDNYCHQKSWEKAEMQMLKDSISQTIEKAGSEEIDLVVLGDLNNQLAISNYVMRDLEVPFLGIYAACSSFTESVIVASSFLENNFGKNVLCGASSHNSTSERQFRNPTEYGGQKPDTTTYTVTGSGTCILSKDVNEIIVSKATIGMVYDADLKDSTDLGRAMAPATALTLLNHLADFNTNVDEYDYIVTGDLSYYGKKVFIDILSEHGVDLKNNYEDCGILMYDRDNQDVFAGGSGCGCSTLATLGYLVKKIKQNDFKKVLVIATGALMNPIMIAQKETIPCIAHAIVLERVGL